MLNITTSMVSLSMYHDVDHFPGLAAKRTRGPASTAFKVSRPKRIWQFP